MICEGVCFVQDDYALQMPCSSKEWFLYIYIFLYMGEKAVSIPKPTCKVPLSVDRCGIKLGRTVSICACD